MFLAELAQLFSDPAFTARLRGCNDNAELYAMLASRREADAAA
jgi:mannitol/fructose-specific phosphotransferase system IIA component (Ntr-type)